MKGEDHILIKFHRASDTCPAPEPQPSTRFYPNFHSPTFVYQTWYTNEVFPIIALLFLISPPKSCLICRFSSSKVGDIWIIWYLCRHGKFPTFGKFQTFDKYFSIWFKNLEKKSSYQKLLRTTKKRSKHFTTLAACWPSWRPQGWVAVLAQNHDFSNWAGAALSFRQLENAIRTDFQNRFTQNLKLRFFPNFVNGHKWSWLKHLRQRLCSVRASI